MQANDAKLDAYEFTPYDESEQERIWLKQLEQMMET